MFVAKAVPAMGGYRGLVIFTNSNYEDAEDGPVVWESDVFTQPEMSDDNPPVIKRTTNDLAYAAADNQINNVITGMFSSPKNVSEMFNEIGEPEVPVGARQIIFDPDA